MRRFRRIGILLALAALAFHAMAPAIAHSGTAPSDYCSAGGGESGGTEAAAGNCPCCRLHVPHAVLPTSLPIPLRRTFAPEMPRADPDHRFFDRLLSWRARLTQGPPWVS